MSRITESSTYWAYTNTTYNPHLGWGAYGVLLFDESKAEIREYSKDTDEAGTSNEIEYVALIGTLDLLREKSGSTILCSVNSELVVNQLRGECSVNSASLERLIRELRGREGPFSEVKYRFVPKDRKFMIRTKDIARAALVKAWQ